MTLYARLVVGLALLFIVRSTLARTWDEPMHADVVREADAFVFAVVVAPTRIDIKKSLAGEKLSGEIELTHFWHMPVMSVSSDDLGMPEPAFQVGNAVYLFLAKSSDKGWGLASPYAGVAWSDGGKVTGNFRLSCTGAMFVEDWYAQAQREFFGSLHGNSAALKKLDKRVRATLREPAATFRGEIAPDSAQALRFFRQHAALEMMAEVAKLGVDIELEPYLQLNDWQGQLSAVRALAARDGKSTTKRLLAVVADRRLEDIIRTVAAVELLDRELDANQLKSLRALKALASRERVSLCNNGIMDPRFPRRYATSEHDAITALLKKK